MSANSTDFKYYAVISDLITTDELPELLSFIRDGVPVYYKDYKSSISIDGSSASGESASNGIINASNDIQMIQPSVSSDCT
jgi:hypothetical protein